MGVDRWVAMIGAWDEIHAACLVVDAGTAVTIDALDGNGQHLGGQILPGVTLMSDALASSTSDIPDTSRRSIRGASGMEIFANNTGGAVAHGTLSAVTGAIERAARALRDSRQDPELILTGGDASRILKSLDGEPIHRPHLVLQGLAKLLEYRQ
jgi:type III pantothenate kinase